MGLSRDVRIRAIAPWFGGKRTLAPKIARECCRADGRPPKAFWEICAGSMAVSLAMPRCSHHHVVDLHGDLMNLARVIAHPSEGPRLYRALRRILSHERSFAESKAALQADDRRMSGALFDGDEPLRQLDPHERALHFFIVSWQGRNGVAGTERTNYQPAIRWTSGGGTSGVRFAAAVASLPAWRRRLRDISILERDALAVVPKIADQDGTSIYLDPPYVRDGKTRSGSCVYKHEFSAAEHTKLRDMLVPFKRARVVVSYYDHPAIRELYAGWTFVECATQKNLHVQNRRGAGRCAAPEVLLINGPSYTSEGSRPCS